MSTLNIVFISKFLINFLSKINSNYYLGQLDNILLTKIIYLSVLELLNRVF